MFVGARLTQLQRATADGVPVKGCFYWSAMDSLEWTAGFGNRFGLVHVGFKAKTRTPKLGATWFVKPPRATASIEGTTPGRVLRGPAPRRAGRAERPACSVVAGRPAGR